MFETVFRKVGLGRKNQSLTLSSGETRVKRRELEKIKEESKNAYLKLQTKLDEAQTRHRILKEKSRENLAAVNQKLTASREKVASYKEIIHRKEQGLVGVRESLRAAREGIKFAAPFPKLTQHLESLDQVKELLSADVFLAVTAEALPYAFRVKGNGASKIFCDATEIPDLGVRTLTPNWSNGALEMMNKMVNGYLYECDGILTVGWELGKHLDKYNLPVHVFPNYRYAEEFKYSNALREQLGLREDEELVLAMSTIASGFETILLAVNTLPSNVHLAVLGNIVPTEYAEKMEAYAVELGVEKRVHIVPPVPYEELTRTISSASVGLIVRDPSILNNYVSLPNRVFDYMFGGVATVSANMPDIKKLLEGNGFGIIVEDTSPECWARAITEALEKRQEMHLRALEAAQHLIWERQETDIYSALGCPESITIFGQKNLLKHNRTLRIAKTLKNHGVNVKLAVNSVYLESSQNEYDSFEVVSY